MSELRNMSTAFQSNTETTANYTYSGDQPRDMESFVTVPKSELIQLQYILKSQQSKLKANTNLSTMIYEKDMEIKQMKEMNQQLKLNLNRAEGRLSSATKAQGVCDSVYRSEEQPVTSVPLIPRRTKLVARGCVATNTNSVLVPRGGDDNKSPSIETDCCVSTGSTTSPSQTPLVTTYPNAKISATESRFSFASISDSLHSGASPGVSRVMFENVVKDNVKLKKKLAEIIQQEGKSGTKTYLETTEYDDAISKLRHDIQDKEQQIQQFLRIIKSNKPENVVSLTSTVTDLSTKVSKLEKGLRAKTSLCSSLADECDRLKLDNSRLGDTLKGKNTKIDEYYEKHGPLDRQEEDLLNFTGLGITESELQSENVQALVERLTAVEKQLETSRSNEARQKKDIVQLKNDLTAAIKEKNDLSTRCKELYEKNVSLVEAFKQKGSADNTKMSEQNAALQQQIQSLKQDVGKLVEEKDIYQTQMQIFESDFIAEKKERDEEKVMHNKQISQLQIHIRRLTVEVDRLNKLLNEERKRIRSRLSMERLGSNSPDSMLSCGLQQQSLHHGSMFGGSTPVVADGYGAHQIGSDFECPRCMRTFEDEAEWQSHCDKCLDS